MGMPILELKDNVAHSNTRFGLRFFKLAPRQVPCKPIGNSTGDNIFLGENESV